MRRLLALVIIIVLVAIAVYYWRQRPARLQGPRQVLESVSQRLQATKTAAAVKAALELDRELKGSRIDVDAGDREGVVILRGEVPRDELKAAAGRVASAVPEVRQVVNDLRVNPSLSAAEEGGRTLAESFDDRTLEAKVKLAFSLDRDLKGTDIAVSSYRRQLTLSGRVETPAQHQRAVEIARRTADVAGVTDQITVGQGGPAASPASPPASPASPHPGAWSRPADKRMRVALRRERPRSVAVATPPPAAGSGRDAGGEGVGRSEGRRPAGGPLQHSLQVSPRMLTS